MSIEAVKEKNEGSLMQLPNVIGVGIGEKAGRKVIKVFVTHKVPATALGTGDRIPDTLEGFEIDVEEIGTVTAQGHDQNIP